jgi:hypothetical protein
MKVLIVIALVVGAVMVMASLAPHPIHRTAAVTRSDSQACGDFGQAMSAVLTDSAGAYGIYSIKCRSGIRIEVAR